MTQADKDKKITMSYETFKELTDAIKTFEDAQLSAILDKWEIISEEDTLKALKTFNIDASYLPEGGMDEEDKYKVKLFQIGDGFIAELKYIKNLKKEERPHQHFRDDMEYLILLNFDITNNIPFCNTIFKYKTETERNREWGKILTKLRGYDVIIN